MCKCKYLEIIIPQEGTPYGKCPFMNIGIARDKFLQIKSVVKRIDESKSVVPNNECPFYNQGISQRECPYFEQ